MEIAWFSEMGFNHKTPRTHKNMRTEFAWFVALDAIHHNILKLQELPDNTYDLGVIIIPKHVEQFINFDIVGNLKRVWVHTCSLDHKHALKNYLSRGMKIFKKETISI